MHDGGPTEELRQVRNEVAEESGKVVDAAMRDVSTHGQPRGSVADLGPVGDTLRGSAVRYTVCASRANYAGVCRSTVAELEARGFRAMTQPRWNAWGSDG